MRKAHDRVIQAFIAGKPAHDTIPKTLMNGERGTVSRLHTDGVTLYSYRMAIAKRVLPRRVGVRYVLVKRSKCPTATTRAHLQSLVMALYNDKELVREKDEVAPDFDGVAFAMPANGPRVDEEASK